MSLDEHGTYYELPDDNHEYNSKVDYLANSIIQLLENEGANYEVSKTVLNMCLEDLVKSEVQYRRI